MPFPCGVLPLAPTLAPGTFAPAIAPLEGDFNDDGWVDSADYVAWRNGLGGVYDENDYADWRANFGAISPAAAPNPGAFPMASVPEPALFPLLIVTGRTGTGRRPAVSRVGRQRWSHKIEAILVAAVGAV